MPIRICSAVALVMLLAGCTSVNVLGDWNTVTAGPVGGVDTVVKENGKENGEAIR